MQPQPEFRLWDTDVRLAFAERDWLDYLVPPHDEDFKFDPRIALKFRAFLSHSIPFEDESGIEHYETAAEIYASLKEQHGSRTREDELRLEIQLIHLRKTGSDSIDDHIAKFKTLIASVMAQQDPSSKYKNDKRNQLFLATLEYSDIEYEKWEMFIPFLGNTWTTMTPDSLFSATKTYYHAHILPKKKKSGQVSGNTVEGSAYFTQVSNSNSGNSGNYNYNNNNNNNNGGGGGGGNNKNDRSYYEYDSSKYCVFHSAPGHSTDECRAKLQDESYLDWLKSQKNPSARGNRTGVVKSLRTLSEDEDIWVYDSCCTDCMTGRKDNFQSFTEFKDPVAVYGVGKALLQTYGQGNVTLEDTAHHNTHGIQQLWYVPGIQESIISSYQTRNNGLKSSMDSGENFVLTARLPDSSGSTFSATTEYINRMAVFPTIRAVKPAIKVLVTTSGDSTDSPRRLRCANSGSRQFLI
jgi:hypothetical protein